MSSGKFRISLSLAQIDWIISNSQQDMPELHKQLLLLKTKADLGYTKPSYEIKPVIPKQKRDLPIEVQYKMASQYLERGEPVPENLMPAYNEFRYMNDLMSEEESELYDAETGF